MDFGVPEAWVALAVAAVLALRKWRRREPLPALPADWRVVMQARVPHLVWLDDAQRARHAEAVQALLSRVRFVGCGGYTVTDEARIVIAALAALLVLRPGVPVFPQLRSVLVYPQAFRVPQTEPDELGLVSDEPVEQIGESWSLERVVLSWADVEAALAGDAVNVVVHEFAHQLDDETPEAEGAPVLTDYSRWAEVMTHEFERLRRHRRPPVLDPYGAESPGEFFGVVTEAFFQRPLALRRHHAELYALLADYYRLDPAARPLFEDVLPD